MTQTTSSTRVNQFAYTLEYKPANSSVVEAVYYNTGSRTMVVGLKHNGRVSFYPYVRVPAEIFNEFASAHSAGSYYSYYVRGRFNIDLSLGHPSDPWAFTSDTLTVPDNSRAKYTYELSISVAGDRGTVRVPGDTIDDALTAFRTDPAKYLNLEVLGVKLV